MPTTKQPTTRMTPSTKPASKRKPARRGPDTFRQEKAFCRPLQTIGRLVTIRIIAAAPSDPRVRIQWHGNLTPFQLGDPEEAMFGVPIAPGSAFELTTNGRPRSFRAARQHDGRPRRTVVIRAAMEARQLGEIGLMVYTHDTAITVPADFLMIPFVQGRGFTITVDGELISQGFGAEGKPSLLL